MITIPRAAAACAVLTIAARAVDAAPEPDLSSSTSGALRRIPNPTCVAPPRPSRARSVKLTRVHGGLAFAQPVAMVGTRDSGTSPIRPRRRACPSLATLAYLPATVFPCGLSASGLPIGLEVVGAERQDSTTIEIANLINS